ncbi:MAG: YajG family lipoprotein [Candidatus Omnitrophota bacterium]
MKICFLCNTVRFFVAIVAIAMFSGCAFGNRYISLQYQPVTTLSVAIKQNVAIVKFTDTREKPELGEMRNGYGMKTADVLAKDQDVGAWVANALSDELIRAGYNVQKFSDAAPSDAEVVISGSVPEAYVKMYMTYSGTVRVSVTVTKSGVVVLNKEYTGHARGLAMLCSTGDYENMLKRALQDIMKKMIPDITKAIG